MGAAVTSTWTGYARKKGYRERATWFQEAVRKVERDSERRGQMEEKRKAYDALPKLGGVRRRRG